MKFSITAIVPSLLLTTLALADKVPFERLDKDNAVSLNTIPFLPLTPSSFHQKTNNPPHSS